MNDLKVALRQIRKRPSGTLVILGTLSLVIGAMGLILGLLQSDRARWMPFPQPDEVVKFWQVSVNGSQDMFSVGAYQALNKNLESLESIAAIGRYDSMVLTGQGEAKLVSVQRVSEGIFDVIDIPLQRGRPFSSEEVRDEAQGVVIISDEIWGDLFNRSPSVLEYELTLDKRVHRIIGVMAPGMESNAVFYGNDIWLPGNYFSPGKDKAYTRIVGRRKPTVSSQQLDSELAALMASLGEELIHGSGFGNEETSLVALRADQLPGAQVDEEVVFGLSIPFLVLGIAAFNVANILLARMLNRRHEFAVRFSLGANRWRIIRQLIIESTVLALLAALIGMVFAYGVAQWARVSGLEAEFGPKVFLGTTLFALLAGIVVGWLPAVRATRGDFSSDLKDAAVAAAGGGLSKHRLRNFLVVGQVGMATVLCVAAGLMLRSQVEKRKFEPGFNPSQFRRITATVDAEQYPNAADRALYNQSVLERVAGIPGVEAVGMASDRVVDRYPFHMGFTMPGEDQYSGSAMGLTVVSPNYLSMLDVPLLRGRFLEPGDRLGSPDVVVVNEAFAARYFPRDEAIGEEIGVRIGGEPVWLTIVGVVADRVNLGRKRDLGPEAYVSVAQVAPEWVSSSFLVKMSPGVNGMSERIRESVQAVNVDLPLGPVIPVSRSIERAMEANLAGLRVMTGIGVFGLAIAMLGIYGVVGYSVTERRREFGIRMALGCSKGGILQLIFRQGFSFALVGLGIGLVLALGITLSMGDFVYGIRPFDVPTYSVVFFVLAVAAGLATLIPGIRAVRIDPSWSLRHE